MDDPKQLINRFVEEFSRSGSCADARAPCKGRRTLSIGERNQDPSVGDLRFETSKLALES